VCHDRVDIDDLELGKFLGPLQPRQCDQFGDHLAKPPRLGEYSLAEVADGVGVVGGFQHRLGEQAHGADRCLEFMADVGHEIAPGCFHSCLLGIVVGEQYGEAGFLRRQRTRNTTDRDPATAGKRVLGSQIEFGGFTCFQYLFDRRPGTFIEQLVAHQTEFFGTRVHENDIAVFVHNRDTAFRSEHDQVEDLGHGEP